MTIWKIKMIGYKIIIGCKIMRSSSKCVSRMCVFWSESCNICWVECASKWSFPFFTSTISVGRGCNQIAQCKTEFWERRPPNGLTFKQICHSAEQANYGYQRKEWSQENEYMVFVNHSSWCLGNAVRLQTFPCKNTIILK